MQKEGLMKSTASSHVMYSARGFGPRQLELLNWFVENPTAECTTTEMYKLNVCKLPERAQKRFIDAQSFVSDRLRSLVERGLLQRAASASPHDQQRP